MGKNLLFLLGGIGIGLLAAFLIQFVMSAPKGGLEEPGYESEDTVNAALDRLDMRMEQLLSEMERRFSEFGGEVARLRTAVESQYELEYASISSKHPDSEEEGPAKERIPPTYASKVERIKDKRQEFVSTFWLQQIDKDLAKMLLEEGISPFDDGVAPILKGAFKKIEEADDFLEKQKTDLHEQYHEFTVTTPEACRNLIRQLEMIIKEGGGKEYEKQLQIYSIIKSELELYDKRHAEERESILESFSSSLAMLKCDRKKE